jgi:hypothetical protein
VHCLPQPSGGPGPENETARYACLQRQLVSSWREGFRSDFGFVGVQLPGYLGDCGDYGQCMAEVFEMRLQQQAGVVGQLGGSAVATVTPTYDYGCPPGVDVSTKTAACPFGSVHNVNKRPIGQRVAAQIFKTFAGRGGPAAAAASGAASGAASAHQWPGPTLARVQAAPAQGAAGSSCTVTLTLRYAEPALSQAPTQNCVACCTGGGVGDFDASFDGGRTWVNGSRPVLVNATALRFDVVVADSAAGAGGTGAGAGAATASTPAATAAAAAAAARVTAAGVTHVRYTANQPFPQCAVYSSATLGPALPFRVELVHGGWPGHSEEW